MHFAFRMLASPSGAQRRRDSVTHLYGEFTDCVPMAKGFSGVGKAAGVQK
jgi:hypothetical protein